MKYNLSKYPERLRALADGHTLNLVTLLGYTVHINRHTLNGYVGHVQDEKLPCTLTTKKVGALEFDVACDVIGFHGVVRDQLKEELFKC